MSEIKGRIKAIFEEKHISDKFNTQEIAITIGEETPYPQHISIQLMNSNIDQMIGKKVGDKVTCQINFKGREWLGHADGRPRYYNTIECWRIYKDEAE